MACRSERERRDGWAPCLQLLHAVIGYVITPWALAKQGTYGALGIAAAMLVGLFLISRLVVFAAVVNATLWERRGAA